MLRLILIAGLMASTAAQAQIFRCEDSNGVVEYSNRPGGKDRNCRSVELPQITTIPAPKTPPPRPGASTAPKGGTNGTAAGPTGGGGSRVDDATQRTRDTDRRRIIEQELRKEEVKLVELRKDFRDGEPERQGDERNYQKYLDRVQRMRDEIARTEGNIDSLKKELGAIR